MLIKLKFKASLQIALRINTCSLRVPQGWRNCIRVQITYIHIGIVVLRMKHCSRDISLLFYDLRIVPIVLSWCRLFEQGVSLSLASMIKDLLHLLVNILRFLEFSSQAIQQYYWTTAKSGLHMIVSKFRATFTQCQSHSSVINLCLFFISSRAHITLAMFQTRSLVSNTKSGQF